MNRILKIYSFFIALSVLSFILLILNPFRISFLGHPHLNWNHFLEPFLISIPSIMFYLLLKKEIVVKNNKLKLWFYRFFVLLITGATIHFVFQTVETIYLSYPASFVFRVSYILEEYIGHFIAFTSALFLSYILAKCELSKNEIKLSAKELLVSFVFIVLTAFLWAFSIIEGGYASIYLVPLSLMLVIYHAYTNKLTFEKLTKYQWNFLFVGNNTLFVVLVLIWFLLRGGIPQFSELGWFGY